VGEPQNEIDRGREKEREHMHLAFGFQFNELYGAIVSSELAVLYGRKVKRSLFNQVLSSLYFHYII
jgi:hypothetical protein